MESNHEILINLYKDGLISKEVLAVYLNEDSISKKNNRVLTESEKREELAAKNREKAEASRKKIAELEKKYKDEYIGRERDKEIKKMTEFLLELENSRGEHVYSISDVKGMNYVELFSLYNEISSRMPVHSNVAMNNRHYEMPVYEKEPEVEETRKEMSEFISPTFEEPKKEATGFIPPAFEEPKKEVTELFSPAIEEPKKEATELFSPAFEEQKKEVPAFVPPVFENKSKELIDEPKAIIEGAGDIMDDFDKEETYEKAKESAFAEEPYSSVKKIEEPTPERKAKLASSKTKVLSKALGAITVVASLALITMATGPIGGIASFVGLRYAIKNNKWNPKGEYLNYIKENMEWMFKGKGKTLASELGGKVR